MTTSLEKINDVCRSNQEDCAYNQNSFMKRKENREHWYNNGGYNLNFISDIKKKRREWWT